MKTATCPNVFPVPSPTKSKQVCHCEPHSSATLNCVFVRPSFSICSPLTFSMPYATEGNGTHVPSINSTAVLSATVSTCICSCTSAGQTSQMSTFSGRVWRRCVSTERFGAWKVIQMIQVFFFFVFFSKENQN